MAMNKLRTSVHISPSSNKKSRVWYFCTIEIFQFTTTPSSDKCANLLASEFWIRRVASQPCHFQQPFCRTADWSGCIRHQHHWQQAEQWTESVLEHQQQPATHNTLTLCPWQMLKNLVLQSATSNSNGNGKYGFI